MIDRLGQLCTTKEERDEVLTVYNETLLSRKPHPEEYQDIHNFKKDALKVLEDTELAMAPPTMEQYIQVLDKVYSKNKNMFREMWTQISQNAQN